jgi:serine protease
MTFSFNTYRNIYILIALYISFSPGVFALENSGASFTVVSSTAYSARVIVKYKNNSKVVEKIATSQPTAHNNLAALATASLGQRSGMKFRLGRALSTHSQVVFQESMSSEKLAQWLSQQPEVEYAVVDQRRTILLTPNDPRFTDISDTHGPAVGQWYLRTPNTGLISAINAEHAWDVTTGSSNVVVAVLDTGIRYDHPDLEGKILPGYDFISNRFVSNDGDLRDANATDPGDGVTRFDIDSTSNNVDCNSENLSASSWHGTQTAGIIGAATNNGKGIAGIGWNVKILPVRVLGRCGGYDSDIIAGMQWAADRASILNLSLGAGGACTSAFQDAINAIVAKGVVIVAAAGNTTGHAVRAPANCRGVIAVGGLRHVGTKVGYSDVGSDVTISAPGGNCVNTRFSQPCLYPITTTTNAGTYAAAANNESYTTSYGYPTTGTSFSAPMVSGTIALMLSLRPSLTPAQIKLILQQSARPFPTSGAENVQNGMLKACTLPQYNALGVMIDQEECYCTTNTCGAGMLDAYAATQLTKNYDLAILKPQARIDAGTAGVPFYAQSPITLLAVNSVAPAGRSIVSWTWTLLEGQSIVAVLDNATSEMASFTPTAAGIIKVGLRVVDNTGALSESVVSLQVTDAKPTLKVSANVPLAGTESGGGGGGALNWPWIVLMLISIASLYWQQKKNRNLRM